MDIAASPVLDVPLSVLDVAPVTRGMSVGDALQHALEYADAAERLGYARIWYAEHHNMPAIASSAPEVLISTVAARTSRISVGSGGVMLPNHAPLMVAERFGTLEALHPGRIDLGIGRAPGTDPRTAAALRGGLGASGRDLPELLFELFGFTGGFPEGDAMHGMQATPGYGYLPRTWLLGSSGSSAQLAAQLGLRFATAHHFAPMGTIASMEAYREHFRPSVQLDEPYGVVTVQVVAAPTEDEARELADAVALMFLRMRMGARPDLLPTKDEIAAHPWTDEERAFADHMLALQAVGTPEQVVARLAQLQESTGAQELMVTSMLPDPADRLRSLELVAVAAGIAPVTAER